MYHIQGGGGIDRHVKWCRMKHLLLITGFIRMYCYKNWNPENFLQKSFIPKGPSVHGGTCLDCPFPLPTRMQKRKIHGPFLSKRQQNFKLCVSTKNRKSNPCEGLDMCRISAPSNAREIVLHVFTGLQGVSVLWRKVTSSNKTCCTRVSGSMLQEKEP
jgi:hypothetical protein